MVTLFQAYDQVGDADAVVTASMDKRWQWVLGTLGEEAAPFSQGSLVAFRERLMVHDLDRKLVARTVECAKATGKFGWQQRLAWRRPSPGRAVFAVGARCHPLAPGMRAPKEGGGGLHPLLWQLWHRRWSAPRSASFVCAVGEAGMWCWANWLAGPTKNRRRSWATVHPRL